MDKSSVIRLTDSFDTIAQQIPDEDIEFWYARDLQEVLGYIEWRNLFKVIEKSRDSALNAGVAVEDHFVGVNKMVRIGSGSEGLVEDVMLTGYAWNGEFQ